MFHAPDFCENCSIRLNGAFCANCGQKSQERDPTLRDFLHDLTHELLHFDGKIFKSVWTLLAQPGVLTREYFQGRRVRWVSPIRLYLVFSVAYFGFTALMSEEGDEALHIGCWRSALRMQVCCCSRSPSPLR